MKKVFFSILLFICFTANSQIVRLDSTIQCNQSEIIAKRLNDFHETNRISQATIGFGALLFLTASLTGNTFDNNKNVNALNVAGCAFTAFGTYIYLDSFKYIRFKDDKVSPYPTKKRR